MDVDMWDILKSCFSLWIHLSKTIQQWNATSLALTEYVQQLVLSNEFAHYAWHRIIYLISHPLQLPSSNFTLAMLGIGSLVDTFNPTLSDSNQQERSEKDTPRTPRPSPPRLPPPRTKELCAKIVGTKLSAPDRSSEEPSEEPPEELPEEDTADVHELNQTS
ncbi:hypothetical protein EDC96DRAFT_604187 [Choanephora cucurbitarum]|nr:hypothetical protein EDC96DRAFT_604187 [Choanephora cucurbitarum]